MIRMRLSRSNDFWATRDAPSSYARRWRSTRKWLSRLRSAKASSNAWPPFTNRRSVISARPSWRGDPCSTSTKRMPRPWVALARLYAATSSWQELVECAAAEDRLHAGCSDAARLALPGCRVARRPSRSAVGRGGAAARYSGERPGRHRCTGHAGQHLCPREAAWRIGRGPRPSGAPGEECERAHRSAFQAAQVTEHELLEVSDAIARYRRILDQLDARRGARGAVGALPRRTPSCGGHRRAGAAPETRSGMEALVRDSRARLSVTDEPSQRIEVLSDIAQVEEAALADPAAAFATWARAVADDPTSKEARASLERLADVTSNHTGLAQVYEEQLKAVLDSELQAWFGSRLAEIYETKLGKPERAVELWHEIENIPGSETKALARQESLLRGLGRMQDLADVLAREAEVATDRWHRRSSGRRSANCAWAHSPSAMEASALSARRSTLRRSSIKPCVSCASWLLERSRPRRPRHSRAAGGRAWRLRGACSIAGGSPRRHRRQQRQGNPAATNRRHVRRQDGRFAARAGGAWSRFGGRAGCA